jgi:hypothetical protein
MNIEDIKKECGEVEEMLLRDEMSHTDLANWFTDFCTRIGCEEPEITKKARREQNVTVDIQQPESPKQQEPMTNQLSDGYIIGLGNSKGSTCKLCGRVFTEGEIYAEKGADSLCKMHAVQKGIIKVSVWEYEKMKREQGI